MLGILVGHGHVFTSVSSAIIMTLLLSWKTELSAFTVDLSLPEIRSAVLMGLLGFVIYPVLPNRFIDPWGLVNPREAWITVIALAGIGFINYILLRLYKSRGLYFSAVLGGLVNAPPPSPSLLRCCAGNSVQWASPSPCSRSWQCLCGT
jgi:uncharacterized membrane protein (DUF4010 family)